MIKCWAEKGQNVSPVLTVLSSVRNDFETGIKGVVGILGPLYWNKRCLTIHFMITPKHSHIHLQVFNISV